jgi:hypothetical protein
LAACELDHIVVGAASLEAGARYIREKLEVDIPRGGKHARMGTHNCVMALGAGTYLEVIAIDPEAPAPERPRWYALDDPSMRALLEVGPRVITWVVRVADIIGAVKSAPVSLGAVEPFTRGELAWRLTVPEDGRLPGGGVIPHAIEWDRGLRPWEAMADPGCRLVELALTSPDTERVAATLSALGCSGCSTIVSLHPGDVPGLVARVTKPSGDIVSL